MQVDHTPRGFEIIYHEELGRDKPTRLVQQSSAIGDDGRPGASFLWVGEHNLNRANVNELIEHLQAWADTGSLVPPVSPMGAAPSATVEFETVVKTAVKVAYLRAKCGVRYWEDATVNGVEDTEGNLIPCRNGNAWEPLIELATGRIVNWSQGATASIHYKVCDDGVYELLDASHRVVASIDGYVTDMMSPGGSGYGDYVIMEVNAEGVIEDWETDFEDFMPEE